MKSFVLGRWSLASVLSGSSQRPLRFNLLRRSAQVLLVCVATVLLMGAGDDARFDKLGHNLMCACGCRQVLLECNHVGCSYSDRMRDELSTALTRGDSDDLVLQAFVQKYGPTVLAAPPAAGFNRTGRHAPARPPGDRAMSFVLAASLLMTAALLYYVFYLGGPVEHASG